MDETIFNVGIRLAPLPDAKTSYHQTSQKTLSWFFIIWGKGKREQNSTSEHDRQRVRKFQNIKMASPLTGIHTGVTNLRICH